MLRDNRRLGAVANSQLREKKVSHVDTHDIATQRNGGMMTEI
jgi:hypothetical protein